jgi:hypothetical protein
VTIGAADGSTHFFSTPLGRRRLSSPVWLDADRLVYAQAESVTADTAGSAARIYVHNLKSDTSRLLPWTPMNAEVLDIVGRGV